MNQLFSRTTAWFFRLQLHHLLFWLVYAGFWSIAFAPGPNLLTAYTYSLIILSFHAAASYFNNYVLITQVLLEKKYFLYVVSVMLTIVLACFPMAVVFHKYLPVDDDFRDRIWTVQFFIVNGASIMLTLGITSTLKLFSSWFTEERNRKSAEQLKAEAELKFLKSQINPHFLFNSLNNLYALTLKKSEMAPEVVLKLSQLLRYLLYESAVDWVPLSKEVEYLQSYIELEKLRLGDRAEITFEIRGNIAGKSIEPFLFLNFVENSFKHGVGSTMSEGWVHLLLKVDDENLGFSASNSKSPTQQNLQQPGGIGLENTRKRLDILYPGKHELNIIETSQSYTVHLQIKLKNHESNAEMSLPG